MAEPLVSVIIPCFNGERFIAEAIRSALDQTHSETEVIVIDDGSRDGSLDVIRSFGSSVRWETGDNRGACAARNRGLQMAQGEFIQFLDADDLLHPAKIARQIRCTSAAARQVSFCHADVIPPDDSLAASYRRPMDSDDSVLFVLGGVLQTSAPLHIRSELSAIGGFSEHLPCAQERDLHLRLACAGVQFRPLAEVLYTIRRQANSVSSNYVRVLRQHLDIIERAEQVLEQNKGMTALRRQAIARFLAEDAKQLLFRGAYRDAARYFRASRERSPDGLMQAFPRSLRACARWQPMLAAWLVHAKRNMLAGRRPAA